MIADTPLIFFEDEDEEAVKSAFVEAWARYPTYSPFEIAAYIFKNMRDPVSRGNQAAMEWSTDLEVKERVRKARENGGSEPVPVDPKVAWQNEIQSVYRDDNMPSQEKKVRLEGLKLFGESNGWIIKAIDKKTEDLTRHWPQVMIAQYAEQ